MISAVFAVALGFAANGNIDFRHVSPREPNVGISRKLMLLDNFPKEWVGVDHLGINFYSPQPIFIGNYIPN